MRAKKRILCALLALFLLPARAPAGLPGSQKKVSGYDGGVFFVTDGGLPDGPCLRIRGRVTAPDFFKGLKRIDNAAGTEFRRGDAKVTQFPDALLLQFSVRDMLCPPELAHPGAPRYLNRGMMENLRFSFYWKRGVELRPAGGVVFRGLLVEPMEPYAAELLPELPARLIWSYEFGVPSAGVPLTDDLVLILRTQEGQIVARVAARL